MLRSFVKFMLSVFVVAGIATASYAQDEANMAKPNTKAGSAAWMFTFGGLSSLGMHGFTLGSFGLGDTIVHNVVGAGWKYYLSDDLAIRAMVGFSSASSGSDTLFPGHTSTTLYGIGVGVEMHTHAVYSTSPYFGAQLTFAGGSSDNTHKNGLETKHSGTALGIGVVAGFDWYFTRGIAIGAEYMLGFSTMSSSTVFTPNTGPATTTNDPSVLDIGISSGNVHLVVHF